MEQQDKPNGPASPVRTTPLDFPGEQLQDGIGLCLSGGGYRAMVFHLGMLWRLNELGYLGKLARISSVSGGSITAGVLGLKWNALGFVDGRTSRFGEIVQLIRAMASRTIDIGSVFGGVFGPGTVSDKIAKAYDEHLFHGATLQDLPDTPRFVLNATNVQSTALFRFSKPFAADWRVGIIQRPKIPLAVAVAASSAFPPLLSPIELPFEEYGCVVEDSKGADLHKSPYTEKAILTDGGVYDNLGLETVWKQFKTVLISDAGGHVEPEEDPHRDWARHSYRILNIVDNQVRSLRKRQAIEAFCQKDRLGTYWGIRTDIADYELADSLSCPAGDTMRLAEIPTRLKAMPLEQQEALINWGYAVCDAAMRRHVDATLGAPARFPYDRGVKLQLSSAAG